MLHRALRTRRAKRAVMVTVAFILLYVVSYIVLSLNGQFEPSLIGTNGVKEYSWAPSGFVNDYKWNRAYRNTFLPLWFIDTHCWHQWNDAYSGSYPIHDPQNIEDVYRGWAK